MADAFVRVQGNGAELFINMRHVTRVELFDEPAKQEGKDVPEGTPDVLGVIHMIDDGGMRVSIRIIDENDLKPVRAALTTVLDLRRV